MINAEIKSRAEDFRMQCQQQFPPTPSMELDYSGPSLGLLSALVTELYLKAKSQSARSQWSSGLAAYVGILLHQCWQTFCDDVTVTGERWPGVTIRGTLYGGTQLVLPLEQILAEFLEQWPALVPSAQGSRRVCANDWGKLGTLFLALADGSHPAIIKYGPVGETLPTKQFINRVTPELAKSAAAYYRRLYPGESIGQSADLYLSQLINPPLHFNETIYGYQAALGLARYLHDHNIPTEQQQLLLKNLLLSTQEQFSIAASICLLAFTTGIDELALLCQEVHGGVVAYFRPNICSLRQAFDLAGDWIKSHQFASEERQRFFFEKNTGLLPWVQFSVDYIADQISDPLFGSLLQALANLDSSQAYALIAQLESKQGHQPELLRQRAHLDLLHNCLPRALANCQACSILQEQQTDWLLLHNYGRCFLASDRPAQAIDYLQQALSVLQTQKTGTAGEFTTIHRLLAQAYLAQRDYVHAEQQILEAVNCSHLTITPILERAQIAFMRDDLSLARQIVSTLLSLYPTQRLALSLYQQICNREMQLYTARKKVTLHGINNF